MLNRCSFIKELLQLAERLKAFYKKFKITPSPKPIKCSSSEEILYQSSSDSSTTLRSVACLPEKYQANQFLSNFILKL